MELSLAVSMNMNRLIRLIGYINGNYVGTNHLASIGTTTNEKTKWPIK